jgi:hypothetical protein
MKSSILTTFLSVVLAVTFTGTASAETNHSKVAKVHHNVNTASGQIAIVLTNGDVLFAAGDPLSGCPARSADAIKTWVSMAQAAFLASKELEYNYSVSPYAKCIVGLTLQ